MRAKRQDGERERLRQQASEAALSLGEEEESAGNLVGALPWLRRAISLDPYDEPLLRRLINLLAGLGDGPNAVRE